jgi:ferredoxin
MMRVKIIKEDCTGCGVCPGICPDLFEMEDGIAKAKNEAVPEKLEAECTEAAESCPVEAIVVTG